MATIGKSEIERFGKKLVEILEKHHIGAAIEAAITQEESARSEGCVFKLLTDGWFESPVDPQINEFDFVDGNTPIELTRTLDLVTLEFALELVRAGIGKDEPMFDETLGGLQAKIADFLGVSERFSFANRWGCYPIYEELMRAWGMSEDVIQSARQWYKGRREEYYVEG
mgnify:CR=1 FL=1